MIRTIPHKSKHFITALNNYTLDPDDNEYLKYQLAYFTIDDLILENIRSYRNNKTNEQLNTDRHYFELMYPVTLIESDPMIYQAHENAAGMEYIKLDSLSYLDGKPLLENYKTYQIKGGITCFDLFFTMDIERIPDGYQLPTIIYKSPRYSYSKIL